MNTFIITFLFLIVIVPFIISIYRDKKRNDYDVFYILSLISICGLYIAYIIKINQKYNIIETKEKPIIELQINTTQLNDSIIEKDTIYTYKFKNN